MCFLCPEPGLSIKHVHTVGANCLTSTVKFVCQEVTYPTLFNKTITLDLVKGCKCKSNMYTAFNTHLLKLLYALTSELVSLFL